MRMKRLGYVLHERSGNRLARRRGDAAVRRAGTQIDPLGDGHIDSYGYKVAASMVKIFEEALGGNTP